jgi:hypothetical protein
MANRLFWILPFIVSEKKCGEDKSRQRRHNCNIPKKWKGMIVLLLGWDNHPNKSVNFWIASIPEDWFTWSSLKADDCGDTFSVILDSKPSITNRQTEKLIWTRSIGRF